MPPGIAIFIAVIAIDVLGDGLRDAIDPDMKTEAEMTTPLVSSIIHLRLFRRRTLSRARGAGGLFHHSGRANRWRRGSDPAAAKASLPWR